MPATPLDRQRRLYDAIEARRAELGWTWHDVEAQTGHAYETFRALKDTERSMRTTTRRDIEKGLGWETGSAERVEDGGHPAVRHGWRPVGGHGEYQESRERNLLGALGLSATELAEVQQLHQSGVTWVRVIAEAIASLFDEDLDEAVRTLLLAAAGQRVRAVLACQRDEIAAFLTFRNGAIVKPR